MEAIIPAFLFALLAQIGERPAILTAILADRFGRPLTVALAAGLAHGLANGIAAGGALAIAPMLNHYAQALLVAVALLFGGLGGLWPLKPPERLEGWRFGAFLTPLLGIFVLALGERSPFFTFAIGTQGMAWLAAVGATLGALAVAFVAAVLGESLWRRLPLRWLRIGPAALFLIAGAWTGLGALRLT